MIQAVPATKTPSVPTASRGAIKPARFALSLADASTAGAATETLGAATPATGGGNARQDDADDGTELPTCDVRIDPRLAWLASSLPVPMNIPTEATAPPTSAPVVAGPSVARPTVTALPEADPQVIAPALAAPTAAAPTGVTPGVATSGVEGPATADSTTAVPVISAPAVTFPTTAGPAMAAPVVAAPAVMPGVTLVATTKDLPVPPPLRGEAPPAVPPAASIPGVQPAPTIVPANPDAPIATAMASAPAANASKPVVADAKATSATALPIALPDPARPPAPMPALQAFAGAIRAGWKTEPDDRRRKDEADPLAATGTTGALPVDGVRHAVAASGAAEEQTLDTRRENWPSHMIDHIEALRDSADATSSRIRVAPDALGTIDLSVKRDGDMLHVHFHAAEDVTRTLLADAQPRLAEIAQSRGLRLGDTNVGGGQTGAQPQRAPLPPISAKPTTATPSASEIAAVDDTRIA